MKHWHECSGNVWTFCGVCSSEQGRQDGGKRRRQNWRVLSPQPLSSLNWSDTTASPGSVTPQWLLLWVVCAWGGVGVGGVLCMQELWGGLNESFPNCLLIVLVRISSCRSIPFLQTEDQFTGEQWAEMIPWQVACEPSFLMGHWWVATLCLDSDGFPLYAWTVMGSHSMPGQWWVATLCLDSDGLPLYAWTLMGCHSVPGHWWVATLCLDTDGLPLYAWTLMGCHSMPGQWWVATLCLDSDGLPLYAWTVMGCHSMPGQWWVATLCLDSDGLPLYAWTVMGSHSMPGQWWVATLCLDSDGLPLYAWTVMGSHFMPGPWWVATLCRIVMGCHSMPGQWWVATLCLDSDGLPLYAWTVQSAHLNSAASRVYECSAVTATCTSGRKTEVSYVLQCKWAGWGSGMGMDSEQKVDPERRTIFSFWYRNSDLLIASLMLYHWAISPVDE